MGLNIKSGVKGRGGASKMGVEGEVAEVGGESVVSGGREESVEVEKETCVCGGVSAMMEGGKES